MKARENGRIQLIEGSELVHLVKEHLQGRLGRAAGRSVSCAAHDQLAREHQKLTSEAAMPELPDPRIGWEKLSAQDRRALTELLVEEIVIKRHPSETDANGSRHDTIRAVQYQDPEMEAARLKAVHEARVKIVPRV